ncbi:MAG TPA: CmcJ/NvfI family oxidoreductase [Acidimicrobiales bacterium]|nr:CmcJ/NvfI family oxidoreductase [Acidimicrobiales bacterium]
MGNWPGDPGTHEVNMTAFCRTSMHYLSPTGEGPADLATEVTVLDGRAANLPGWQVCGFELVQHSSAVTDWTDDSQISAVHYEELEKLAREMTGADFALVATHIKRSPDDARRHEQLSPITFVHSDFAAGHENFVRRTYRQPGENGRAALDRNGATPLAVVNAKRTVILQFWRNTGEPKMDFPIAFCDARTVMPVDARAFHVTDYAGTGASFDALGVVEPADPGTHRWYAFPELTADEVVAFRTYDTELVAQGKTYFTPHSAFRDPEVEVGKPARSSIELRATCVFV